MMSQNPWSRTFVFTTLKNKSPIKMRFNPGDKVRPNQRAWNVFIVARLSGKHLQLNLPMPTISDWDPPILTIKETYNNDYASVEEIPEPLVFPTKELELINADAN